MASVTTSLNPEDELLSSIASLSPPLSLKSGTLDMPTVNDSLPPDTTTTPEPTLNTNSTHSQTLTKPSTSNLKTRHSPTPPPNNLHVTIDNHPIPPKKKYNIPEDPVFIDSGILPPTLHPLKTPSQSNTMTDEFLRTHPNFKANLPSLYMTPTTYKFLKTETLTTMLHMLPKIYHNSPFGRQIVSVFSSSNSIFLNQLNMT